MIEDTAKSWDAKPGSAIWMPEWNVALLRLRFVATFACATSRIIASAVLVHDLKRWVLDVCCAFEVSANHPTK
jgi:thiosulfate reductase cytochrome b subunit